MLATKMPLRQAVEVARDRANPRNAEAVEQVMAAARPMIGAACNRWRGHGALAKFLPDIEDVGQECRVVVLGKAMRAFDVSVLDGKDEDAAGAIFGSYVGRAIHTHLLDLLRRDERRVPEVSMSDSRDHSTKTTSGEVWFDKDVTDEYSPAVEPGGLDEREIIGAMRPGLGTEDFQILSMRYDGMTPPEIGRVLGLAPKTVRDRIRKRVAPVARAILANAGYSVPGGASV